jgi:tetratricopeptide (TPR) repeat protein
MLRKSIVIAGMLVMVVVMAVAQAAQNLPKDAAEYNVYYAAVTETDPAKKITALDAYLAKYPNSVAKEQVLEVKLQAQTQAGKQLTDLMDTARALLAVNPHHERARLILAAGFLQAPPKETDPNFQQGLSDAEANAKAGIENISNMKRGQGVSDAEYTANKNVTSSTDYHVLGVIGLLRKDIPSAMENFKKAAELSPNDASLFYTIADTLARQKPVEYDQMLWAFARCAVIEGPQALNAAGKQQVDAYLTRVYTSRHGSDEGLKELKEAAKNSPFPPDGFHIKTKAEMVPPPPPPPPEPPIPDDVTKMPFGQIKVVLSKDDDKAKEVFGKLKAVGGMDLEGKIVSFTAPKTLHIAVLTKTQGTDGAYDIVLVLAAPTLAARVPKGKNIEFEGTVKDYKADPFALTLHEGKIVPPSKK